MNTIFFLENTPFLQTYVLVYESITMSTRWEDIMVFVQCIKNKNKLKSFTLKIQFYLPLHIKQENK